MYPLYSESVAKTCRFARTTFKPCINRFANVILVYVQNFKAIGQKNTLLLARIPPKMTIMTSLSHDVIASRKLFLHKSLRLGRNLGAKFQGNRTKNTPAAVA